MPDSARTHVVCRSCAYYWRQHARPEYTCPYCGLTEARTFARRDIALAYAGALGSTQTRETRVTQ
jgi:ribosomal protein L32